MDDCPAGLVARAAQAGTDALLVTDVRGRVLEVNDAACTVLARDEETLVGSLLGDLVGRAARERWPAHLERMRQAEAGTSNSELIVVRPDGSKVRTLASWGEIPPGGGPRAFWHRLTAYDERRRLLERLSEREEQLATAQELARIGSWEWIVGTTAVQWSAELFRLLGLDPADVTPSLEAARDLVHPEDCARLVADLRGPLHPGQRLDWQLRFVRADGARRWGRGLAVVGRRQDGEGGEGLRVTGSLQDVTDLVEASTQADQARQRLRLLQEVTEGANRAATLAEALDAACEAVGRNSDWQLAGVFWPQEDGDVRGDEVPRLTGRTPEGCGGDALPLDPAGAGTAWRSRRLHHTAEPGRSSSHRRLHVPILLGDSPRCVVQCCIDESPVSVATLELVGQIADQLGNVAARERDAERLAEARDLAEQASGLKSEFVATMSHEIRTPMNGVIGLTELLLRTPLDDQQRTLAEALRGTGHTLLSLINDILDLSKIESGRLELDRDELDVRSVVEQAVAVVAGPAREKGLEVVTMVDPAVPERLVGDPIRLGQVVNNLAANAVKFTDAGEVVVAVRLAPHEDQDQDQDRDRDHPGATGPAGPDAPGVPGVPGPLRLLVEVTDTGIGVDATDTASLFEAFTQADPSATRRHDGTGLGLAICHRLVEAMQGEIGVRSAPGRGSTFWFTVLLATRVDTPPSPRREQLAGVRVLVLDDNASARRGLEVHLDAWGCTSHLSADPARAGAELDRAESVGTPYDLVLVDRFPGDVDAVRLAAGLAGREHPPGLVLLDGSAPERDDPWVSGLVAATASKPARRDDLWQAMLTALGRWSASSTLVRGATVPSGVRVLVAEDNAVNQLVAVGLLESLGCTVDVAVDGEQALSRLGPGHPYHAVLMDCRMPRLDGVEATRRLRRGEQAREEADPVPVLAMTASVLDGERERCLAAGMNDFLTKPVHRTALSEALARWVPQHALRLPPRHGPRPGPSPAAAGGPPALAVRARAHVATTRGEEVPVTSEPDLFYPDDDETPVLDFARVEMLRELVKDGISFFDRTRESFLGRVDQTVTQLHDAVSARDEEAQRGLAHQLKGSAANLGLVRVAGAAEALERHADVRGDPRDGDDIEDLLARLDTSVAQARRALDSVGRTAASRASDPGV